MIERNRQTREDAVYLRCTEMFHVSGIGGLFSRPIFCLHEGSRGWIFTSRSERIQRQAQLAKERGIRHVVLEALDAADHWNGLDP